MPVSESATKWDRSQALQADHIKAMRKFIDANPAYGVLAPANLSTVRPMTIKRVGLPKSAKHDTISVIDATVSPVFDTNYWAAVGHLQSTSESKLPVQCIFPDARRLPDNVKSSIGHICLALTTRDSRYIHGTEFSCPDAGVSLKYDKDGPVLPRRTMPNYTAMDAWKRHLMLSVYHESEERRHVDIVEQTLRLCLHIKNGIQLQFPCTMRVLSDNLNTGDREDFVVLVPIGEIISGFCVCVRWWHCGNAVQYMCADRHSISLLHIFLR